MVNSDDPTTSKSKSKRRPARAKRRQKQQIFICGYLQESNQDYIQPLVTDPNYKGVNFRTIFSYGAECAYHNGDIYVLGGVVEGNVAIPQQFRLDPQYGEPIYMPKMRYPRVDAGVVATPFGVAMIGGTLGNYPTRSCEIFDTQTNTWEYLPSLRRKRFGPQVVYVRDYGLIAINGQFRHPNQNDSEELDDIEYLPLRGRFEESQNYTWQQFPQLPRISQQFAAAAHGNRVFVIAHRDIRLLMYMIQVSAANQGDWHEITLSNDISRPICRPISMAVYKRSLILTTDDSNLYRVRLIHQNNDVVGADLSLQHHLKNVTYPRIVVAE